MVDGRAVAPHSSFITSLNQLEQCTKGGGLFNSDYIGEKEKVRSKNNSSRHHRWKFKCGAILHIRSQQR